MNMQKALWLALLVLPLAYAERVQYGILLGVDEQDPVRWKARSRQTEPGSSTSRAGGSALTIR